MDAGDSGGDGQGGFCAKQFDKDADYASLGRWATGGA